MNGRERPRGPPPNRGPDPRVSPSDSNLSKADHFDDEKKRIIHSCYAKKDADGTCTYPVKRLPLAFTTHTCVYPGAA